MSNQFYNYISSLLIEYFSKAGLKAGDRFYLQLDSHEEVQGLINAFRSSDQANDFHYKHDLGDMYTTTSILFGDHRLVIAYTSESVTPDYLVTLRNLVGEQKGEWKDTSLLSVVSEQLDSIQGGSSDLQKEGMPLHPQTIYKELKREIEHSNLDKVEQIILQDNLDGLMVEQPFKQITFFEFESIFITLKKGYIHEEEYYKFGLFKDPDLDKFFGKDQLKRLEMNRELFSVVRKVQDYGLGTDELDNYFSDEGSKTLIKDDWVNTLFTDVAKYHDDFNKRVKNKKVSLRDIKVKDNLTIWNRSQKDTSAGRRKRHIVVFNPEGLSDVTLQFSFDFEGGITGLNKDYLTINTKDKNNESIKVDVKQSNIFANIKMIQFDQPSFFRFSYKHDKKASLGAEFFISVLPVDPIKLVNFQSNYLVNTKKAAIELQYDEDILKFGDGLVYKKVEISEQNQLIDLTEDHQLEITPLPEAFNDNDEVLLSIRFSGVVVLFILKNELPDTTPISGIRVRKLVRENNMDMQWIKDNNRLVLGNREFYMHPEYKSFFEYEKQIVEDGIKAATLYSDVLHEQNIDLSFELRESYSRFVTYFKTNDSIPSLSYMSEELIQRAEEYITAYNNEIKKFNEGVAAGKKGIDLFKLGTIQSNQNVYFTPFHPLMVAYKLKYYELIGREEIDNSIMHRLSPEALVPYIYDEFETLYKPDHQIAAMDWLLFRPVNQVSISDSNQYLAKVVKDKIAQFKEYFSYLFMEQSNAPLQINVININNDVEVIKGLLHWMIDTIDKQGYEALNPVEVTLYKQTDWESSFDLYSKLETVPQFEYYFDLNLSSKRHDKEDLVRMVREKLYFYKQYIEQEYRYAHITFYKMDAQEKKAVQPMKEMKSGIAIEGLLSSLPSMKDEENYRSGFGIKAYTIENSNSLTSTAYYVNELAANLRNGGNDSYRKGEAVFSRTTTTDEKTLEKVFKSSHWVTFVDPTVDLEYFNSYDGNLVVIHYSDQYSSSSRYDAITVTDKSEQYFAVIKEFLKGKNINGTDENVINTIKAFNTFNGEWLLRIIGSKGHLDREKLSIVSAIKFSLSYLDHPDILWVPISLEEILRVAGAVSLNKSTGVFTAKNLGVSGSHSDDLLLIGIEKRNGSLLIHFYPVEVKIGLNKSNVIEKAREQVRKTKDLFVDTLTSEMGSTFQGKFYRNFFAQLAISGAKRLSQSGFWENKQYELEDEVIEKLLKDDYEISFELEKFSGKGAILSFQKNIYHRSANLDGDILLINLTHSDGFQGLVYPIESIRNWIQYEHNDFIKERMISRQYQIEKVKGKEIVEELNDNDSPPIVEEVSTNNVNKNIKAEEKSEAELPEKLQQDQTNPQTTNIVSSSKKVALEETRILMGKAQNSNKNIYWEFGNKGLANRHLLISGKSGQGKTYFMQCLLLEKAKLGIPSIVVDYTEGFLPNQLEPEFTEYMGDNLKQRIVYNEKLPINPFAKNVRDIGGIEIPESNTDIAERIKSVFSAVYSSLGIQQKNAIYDATLNGLEKHGEHMDLKKLRDMLEGDGSSYSKTALSQIRPLIDRNPFSYEGVIDWNEFIDSNGKVFIIQLTGFPRDVQLMITEFILWDLWNYSVQFGNKNKPIPVIMDEAQNLDHTEKSPSARILTEGRKFGWSGWYATQFLKSQLDADELARLQNSSQKVYFSPPEQELSNIASSLSKDNHEKKLWENKLADLKKGQCIVHGPVLKENGELSNPTITVVDITSLAERIKYPL